MCALTPSMTPLRLIFYTGPVIHDGFCHAFLVLNVFLIEDKVLMLLCTRIVLGLYNALFSSPVPARALRSARHRPVVSSATNFTKIQQTLLSYPVAEIIIMIKVVYHYCC